MGEGGEAVSGKHENGDRCLIYAPGQIRSGLLGQLADASPLDRKARVLAGRTAHGE